MQEPVHTISSKTTADAQAVGRVVNSRSGIKKKKRKMIKKILNKY